MLYIFDSEAFSTILCFQDLNFNAFQGFGVVGADDLTGKSGIDQVRDPADVIAVGHSSALSVTKALPCAQRESDNRFVVAATFPRSADGVWQPGVSQPPGSAKVHNLWTKNAQTGRKTATMKIFA